MMVVRKNKSKKGMNNFIQMSKNKLKNSKMKIKMLSNIMVFHRKSYQVIISDQRV